MQEVQRALVKTFHLSGDVKRIGAMQETLQAAWSIFDVDGNGEVDFDEFTMHAGLGQTLALSVASIPTPILRIPSQTQLGG